MDSLAQCIVYDVTDIIIYMQLRSNVYVKQTAKSQNRLRYPASE